jgi:small subunit ribosomal protein S3Ae
LSEKIPQWDLNNFIKQVTDDNSEFHRELLEKGRKIASLRHIGIKKTKLVSSNKSSVQASTQSEVSESVDESGDIQSESEEIETESQPVEAEQKTDST